MGIESRCTDHTSTDEMPCNRPRTTTGYCARLNLGITDLYSFTFSWQCVINAEKLYSQIKKHCAKLTSIKIDTMVYKTIFKNMIN